MAASFQAKDSQVLNQQLKVQEIVLFANSPLLAVAGSDLVLSINETVKSVLSCQKQVAAGTLTGIVGAVNADPTKITLTGESAAVATTSYVVRYIIDEQA